jgi:hypothetical protein
MTLLTRIRFEEPPAKGAATGRKTKHQKIADKLRKNPGQWALLGSYETVTSANSIAYLIRKGKIAAYPEGHYDSVSRTVGSDHCVYARYLGENGEHA